ncbi:MAG: hypothetical protein M3530_11535 [Thermoproteota archaeon]|nr:hypothetical protein [Thermoproteota archaeon]
MKTELVLALAAIATLIAAMLFVIGVEVNASSKDSDGKWTEAFKLDDCNFTSTGSNTYFILQPGYQTVFKGIDEGIDTKLTTTVLNETKVVDGIDTRIVEERAVNAKTGDVFEVSKNYFAICKETNSAFYFGEDVDWYKDGNVVNHTGSWLHGANNAEAGLMMPGIVLVGSRYNQETAPDVAIDRAEIMSLTETVKTPAGTFVNSLLEKDTDGLDPGESTSRYYAPGIGQIKDDMLDLVSYGYVK